MTALGLLLLQQAAGEKAMPFFWSSGRQVLHTGFMAVAAYLAMVVMLRLTGKRSLSQMNAYDLVVTVAIGSTLASAITAPDVSLADGIVAIGVLIGLQYVLATLAAKSPGMEKILNGEPILLYHRGEFLRNAMMAERITEEEIRAAVRFHGIAGMDEVSAVVVETNGMLSVVKHPELPVTRLERSSSLDVEVEDSRELLGAERRADVRQPESGRGSAGDRRNRPPSGNDRDAPGA